MASSSVDERQNHSKSDPPTDKNTDKKGLFVVSPWRMQNRDLLSLSRIRGKYCRDAKDAAAMSKPEMKNTVHASSLLCSLCPATEAAD